MPDANAFVPDPRVTIEGAPHGPLRGLTFAAKDLFDVAGHPTGGGNHDWARTHPVPTRHAWAVQALLERRLRERLVDVSNSEQVKRFAVLPRPFTLAADEITVSLKLRRTVVLDHYADRLVELYRD